MKKLFLFSLFFILVFLSCEKKVYEKKNKVQKSPSLKKLVLKKNDIRNSLKIKFKDNDTLTVVSSLFTDYKTDSVLISKKNFSAKYYYCGKGRVNLNLFEPLKRSHPSMFETLKSINTAHNIIINQDTLYVLGKRTVSCFSKKDTVNVQASIYKLYFKNNPVINYLIIDKITKIN